MNEIEKIDYVSDTIKKTLEAMEDDIGNLPQWELENSLELLKDLRVASVFRNKKGSFRNQYSVGNASDIYDDFEVYYERWEDEFARGIDGREMFDFDDEDVWNQTNTPGDRVTSHSWEIGYEEEDDYYEPIINNMLNYLKKKKIYKYKNDDGIDAEFTLDDKGNSVDMVIYYTADDVKNSNR